MSKPVVFGNAILWAATIIASALLLKGTPQAEAMLGILSTAAFASTLLFGASCRAQRGRSQA